MPRVHAAFNVWRFTRFGHNGSGFFFSINELSELWIDAALIYIRSGVDCTLSFNLRGSKWDVGLLILRSEYYFMRSFSLGKGCWKNSANDYKWRALNLIRNILTDQTRNSAIASWRRSCIRWFSKYRRSQGRGSGLRHAIAISLSRSRDGLTYERLSVRASTKISQGFLSPVFLLTATSSPNDFWFFPFLISSLFFFLLTSVHLFIF